MRKTLALLCTTIAFALNVSAQLSLDECRRLARENYPLVKKYDLIVLSTDFNLENIRRGNLPRLALSAQATYQSDVAALPANLANMLASTGRKPKGIAKDQYRIALDVQQNIWDGGDTKARRTIAEADGTAQQAETDVELHAVGERVNHLFFGILLLDERLRLNTDLQRLLLSNHSKLQAMQRSGVAMQADADAVKAEHLRAVQQQAELETARQALRRMLALFTGLQEEELTNLEKPSAALPDATENLRPELRLFDAQINKTEAQRRLLDSGVMPRFSLFAQGFYGYPGYDMFDDMFSHRFGFDGIVGVRMNWNISRFYTRRTDLRRISNARSMVENAREVFLFNNRLQSTQSEADIARFRRLAEDDAEIIRLRTAVREAAEAKLRGGVVDANALLQEITRENEARIAASVHEIEMLKSIYELRHIMNQ